MSERIAALQRNLADARAELNRVLDAVGERWQESVYSDGAQWTVQQVVVHLMSSDRGQTNLLKAIARGEEGVPADFDLERYNRRSVEKQAAATPAELRAAMTAAAAERAAWLAAQDESVLDKTGRHASMRVLSIEQILNVIAGHDRAHADDIAKALKIR